MDGPRLYFRIIEQDDGGWACQRGLTQLDRHHLHDAALEHITELAGGHRPSAVFAHYLDGQVRRMAALD
jgi:hypothetical protein